MKNRLKVLNMGTLLTLTSMFLTACGQVSVDEHEYYQRAISQHEAGELRAAVVNLKNVLQQNPSHVDARLRLGLVSIELGDFGTARSELQRALDLGVDDLTAQIAMARVWLADGDHQHLLENLDPKEAHSADDSAQILHLRGEAQLGLGQFDDAFVSFEQSLLKAPEFAPAHVGIASIHLAQDRPQDARASLQAALDEDGRLPQAWERLGDLEIVEGRLDNAEAAYSEAIEFQARPYIPHLKRGLARLARGDRVGTEEDLRALREIGPRLPGTAYLQGLLYFERGQYADAQTALEESLSRAPDHQKAVFFLGASHFALRNWASAEHHLSRFLRIHPESDDASRMLAEVRARAGDLDQAENLLRNVLDRNPDDLFALNLMSGIAVARGDQEGGIDYLRQISLKQPDHPPSHARLAAGLLNAGRPDEAVSELEDAIARAPEDQRLVAAYVISLIEAGEFGAALIAAERMIEGSPDDPLPHNLKAAAHLAKGELEAAQNAMLEAVRLAPGDPAVSINLAQMAMLRGDPDEARRIYKEALRLNPGHLNLSLALARLEAQQGEFPAMRQLLEASIDRHPEALTPRLVLGRFLMGRNEPRRVLALLEPVQQSAGNDREMLDLLAQAQIAAGQDARAVTTLRRLATHVPESAEAFYRLGMGFEEANSARDAQAHYGRALGLNPEHTGSLERLAVLRLRDGDGDGALTLARRLQATEEAATVGYSIEGRVHRAASRYPEAVKAFGSAYEMSPSSDSAVALGLALVGAGQADDAATLWGQRVNENPDEDSVRFQLAQILLTLERHDDAVREYEELVRTQPRNLVVLNNLAFLYQEADDPRALEYAERAYALSPGTPEVLDTLGWILVTQGEIDRGLGLLETARARLPHRPEVRYHYAAALAKAGQSARARNELAALLDEKGDFPGRPDAEALLQRLR